MRSNVRYELQSMWALLGSMLLTIANAFPEAKTKEGLSSRLTIVLVVLIIAAGVGIIYLLVVVPTTSSTYP